MSNPTFNILSNTELYTNRLTPLVVSIVPDEEYSNIYCVWDFGDGTTSSELTATHTYNNPGEYPVTLTRYLASGIPVVSDSYTITVKNLIPNSMNWASNSYKRDTITASKINNTPFIINVLNSYQWFSETDSIKVNLYVEQSKSSPYDPNDKYNHLKPTWKFFDNELNVVSSITLTSSPLYAYLYNGSVYLTTNSNVVSSVYVGLSSIGKFYFSDDIESVSLSSDFSDTLPDVIIASQDLSTSSNLEIRNYSYAPLIYSIYIEPPIPHSLSITEDGYNPIFNLKYENTKIPYTITILDDDGNLLKTVIKNSPLVTTYPISAGFTKNLEISSYPSLSGNSFIEYSNNPLVYGGYYKSYFIPTGDISNIILTASVYIEHLNYNIPLTRNIFSDENSDTVYVYRRSRNIENITEKYNTLYENYSEQSLVEYDGLKVNIYGIGIDFNNNIYLVDSDKCILSIYDRNMDFIIDKSYTTNATTISSHSSPSSIVIGKNGEFYITLSDSFDIIKGKLVGSSILYNTTISLSSQYIKRYNDILGENTHQPASIEYTYNDKLYTSYVSTSSDNFISVLDDSIHNFSNTNSDNITANGEIINTESYAVIDILGNSTGSFVYGLGQHVNTHYGIFYKIDDSNYTISKTISTFDNTNLIIDPIALTIDTNQNIWIAYDNKIVMWNPVTETTISILEFEGYVDAIAGTNTNELLVINRNNNTNYIYTFNVNTLLSSRDIINTTNRNSKFIAMGDWSGFRKQNKYTDLIEYYTNSYLLTGQSQVFNILPRNKYRLEKINEDFDMTETIKSYRTTETMLNYDLLFDQFLGGIFGNKYDDGTFLGRNLYEKIANFVMNHSDIDTCNVKSLKSMCEQVNISFENDIIYPRDIKKIIDLFSIKFKYLWGDTIREGDIQEYKGQEIDIYTYVVSANPPVKFIVEEKFNEHLSVITPLGIYYSDFIYRTNYPLSTYNDDWGWGLSIPYGQQLSSYYKFYELLDVNYSKLFSIIDWNNELTSIELSSITSYDSYFSETGVASIMLGDKLRQGLGLFL